MPRSQDAECPVLWNMQRSSEAFANPAGRPYAWLIKDMCRNLNNPNLNVLLRVVWFCWFCRDFAGVCWFGQDCCRMLSGCSPDFADSILNSIEHPHNPAKSWQNPQLLAKGNQTLRCHWDCDNDPLWMTQTWNNVPTSEVYVGLLEASGEAPGRLWEGR